MCLVTDRTLTKGADDLVRAVEAALVGGVNMVQLREPDQPPDELRELACRLRHVTRDRALLIVNGDPSLAIDVGADGIQVPERGMSMREARKLLEPDMLIGRSVHGVTAAMAAEREGADFLIAGTVFPSRSHPAGPTGGADMIRDVASTVNIPVIGIGGITKNNAAAVVEAGAAGVAVISAILGAADPESASRQLAGAIDLTATITGEAT
ncbi:MAG: thiamine phosphate synthase [Dehalococcoidia bacterium]